MNTKVAIIGNGWVGKAMQSLFPDAITYVRDIVKIADNEEGNFTSSKEVINKADIAFICVPTPNATVPGVLRYPGSDYEHDPKIQGDGALDTSAVEECIAWLETPLIVIRSTVNPGDCDKWSSKYKKEIVFQPEYLGETPAHPLIDVTQTPFMILGGWQHATRRLIDLYTTVFNASIKIRQVSARTAEIIKLTENRAISFKVAQCQELYDVLQADQWKEDYYEIVQAVYGDDPRFNLWWTFVYPDKRGFNSKCIPKDVYAWCAWAESLGYEPKITRALLEKNREWIGGDNK